MLKVILIRDVPGVGKAGQSVFAKDGYARNFLIPKGFAVLPGTKVATATLSALSRQDKLKSDYARSIIEMARSLDGREVVMSVHAGENGKIFGSVGAADIAEKLAIDKKYVLLDRPIKTVGKHNVGIRFSSLVTATVSVVVVSGQ